MPDLVDVIWLSLRPETPCRGFWDNEIVERLLDGSWWRAPDAPQYVHHEVTPGSNGAPPAVPDLTGSTVVVVIAARHHAHIPDRVNEWIGQIPDLVLMLVGDEEGSFPVERLSHPGMRLWVMTPRPDRHAYPEGTRWLPNGPTPHATRSLPGMGVAAVVKPRDWVFAGQITHSGRHEAAAALHLLNPGDRNVLAESDTFAGGLDRDAYLRLLAEAKVAPCPSGPQTPDTFRLWEALEAGCVPVVDGATTRYWRTVTSPPPFPVLADWADLAWVMPRLLTDWQHEAARAGAWLITQRRSLTEDLHADTTRSAPTASPDSLVTVLVPTSPIPTHPSPGVLAETLASIRDQLPMATIVLMCDGVYPDQGHLADAYKAYLRHVVSLCIHDPAWAGVHPVVHGQHMHQAAMTAHALDRHVSTPLVLFVEHDTPLIGDIDWPGLTRLVKTGNAGVVRLHHEATVHPEHEYLMLGPAVDVGGVRVRPTRQWSQRPHLADAAVYRRLLAEHFGPDDRTMIEDVLHGAVQDMYTAGRGDEVGLHLYHPDDRGDGSIQRSRHLDGRATEPKYPMIHRGQVIA
jgi:hypothetical protein